MNLVYVDQEKNLKNVVELYKKNIKYPSKSITIPKNSYINLELKIFSINILILFFFILNVLKSSN